MAQRKIDLQGVELKRSEYQILRSIEEGFEKTMRIEESDKIRDNKITTDKDRNEWIGLLTGFEPKKPLSHPTYSELMKVTKLHRSTFASSLRHLQEMGLVEKKGDVLYTITPEGWLTYDAIPDLNKTLLLMKVKQLHQQGMNSNSIAKYLKDRTSDPDVYVPNCEDWQVRNWMKIYKIK